MSDTETLKSIDNKLSAVIALLSDYRERGGRSMDNDAVKTEVLLREAGLSPAEIAKLVNKNLAAVQKTLQRAKK